MFDDSALLHANKHYDPIKAREYYLRTRKLKGRHRSGEVKPAPKSAASKPPAPKPAAQKRQEVEAQVKALKDRLERLRNVLAKLVERAKTRSGVETPHETATRKASSQQDSKGSSPKTAKQKRDAAKSSKEYYDKNKPHKSPTKEIADLKQQIDAIEKKIREAARKALENPEKPKSRPVVPTQRRHDKAVDTN